jgi:hypothetical protein
MAATCQRTLLTFSGSDDNLMSKNIGVTEKCQGQWEGAKKWLQHAKEHC